VLATLCSVLFWGAYGTLFLKTGTFMLEKILAERGKRYGSFEDNAIVTNKIFTTLTNLIAAYESELSSIQIEALHMLSHKLSRIIVGDSQYSDSWHDAAGYMALVANYLDNNQKTN
jgi:hypothetical protein